uniref:Ribosomal protein L34 n=1 Tax=Anotrichium furcellatum TaxID=41999 RepID=A0A4D6WNI3_9FLOR|nr:ribosomal protein L34 [Anotrichium furcellatum]
MNNGTNIKRKRKSGFRARMKTTNGKNILKARRNKKRYYININ